MTNKLVLKNPNGSNRKNIVVPTSKICHGQKIFFILEKWTEKEKFMAICICIMGAEKNGLKNLFMFFRANQTTQKRLKIAMANAYTNIPWDFLSKLPCLYMISLPLLWNNKKRYQKLPWQKHVPWYFIKTCHLCLINLPCI